MIVKVDHMNSAHYPNQLHEDLERDCAANWVIQSHYLFIIVCATPWDGMPCACC